MSRNTYKPTSFANGDTYNERTDRFVGVNLTEPQFLVGHSRGVLSNNYVLQPTGRVETRDGYEQLSALVYLRGVWDFVSEHAGSLRVALFCKFIENKYREYIGVVSYMHDGKFIKFNNDIILDEDVPESVAKSPAHAVSSNGKLYILTGHGFYVYYSRLVENESYMNCELVRNYREAHIPTTRYMGIARNVKEAPAYNNITLEYPNLLRKVRKERYLLGIPLSEDNVYPAIRLGARIPKTGFTFTSTEVTVETLDDEGKALPRTIRAIPIKLETDGDDLSGDNITKGTWFVNPSTYESIANHSVLAQFYINALEAGDYVLVSDREAFIELLQSTTDSQIIKPIRTGPFTRRDIVASTKVKEETVTTGQTTSTGSYDFGIYFNANFISYLQSLGASGGNRAGIMSEFFANSSLKIAQNSTTSYSHSISDVFSLTTGGWGMKSSEHTTLLAALSALGVTSSSDGTNVTCVLTISNGANVSVAVSITPSTLYSATGLAIIRSMGSVTETINSDFAVLFANNASLLSALGEICDENVTSVNQIKDLPISVFLDYYEFGVGDLASVNLYYYGQKWSDRGCLLIEDTTDLLAALAQITSEYPQGSGRQWSIRLQVSGGASIVGGNIGVYYNGFVNHGIGISINSVSRQGTLYAANTTSGVDLTELDSSWDGWNQRTVSGYVSRASSETLTSYSDWVNTYAEPGSETSVSTTTENTEIINYDNALLYVDSNGDLKSRNEFIYDGTGTDVNHCAIGVMRTNDSFTEIYFFKNFAPTELYRPNVTVQYSPVTDEQHIENCRIIDEATSFAKFGANNSLNRLWLYGSPSMPNYAIHSQEPFKGFGDNTGVEEGDFTYFPDEGMIKFGEKENAIVGMGVVSTDSMAVIKNHHGKDRTMFFVSPTYIEEKVTETDSITREEYKTSLSNTITAGLSKEAFADVNGDLLFVSHEKKVVGLDIEGITGDSQRVANTRSFYIDGVLSDADMGNVHLFVYADKIYLSLDDKLYLSAINSKSSETAQYEWWPCDPFPAPLMSVNVLKDTIWLGCKDGSVFGLRKPTEEDPETCDIKRFFMNDETGMHAQIKKINNSITVDSSVVAYAKKRFINTFDTMPHFDSNSRLAHCIGDGIWVADKPSFLKQMGDKYHYIIISVSVGVSFLKVAAKVVICGVDDGQAKFKLVIQQGTFGGSMSAFTSVYAVLEEVDYSTPLSLVFPDTEEVGALIAPKCYALNNGALRAYKKDDLQFQIVDGVSKVYFLAFEAVWAPYHRYYGRVNFVRYGPQNVSGLAEIGSEDDFVYFSLSQNNQDSLDIYEYQEASFENTIYYLLALPKAGQRFYCYKNSNIASDGKIYAFEKEIDMMNLPSSKACQFVPLSGLTANLDCYFEVRTPIVPQFATLRLSNAKIGYDKTVQNVTIWNDSKSPCELYVGALTNKNYIVADDNKVLDAGLGIDFDNFSFEHTDFDKNSVPRLYNLKKFPRNQQTLTITFTGSGKRNSVLAGIDILYHIKPAKNKR